MSKVQTSSSKNNEAPSTPEEKAAAAEYKKNLEAEVDAEYGDASKSKKDEPTVESETKDEESTDTEQEQSLEDEESKEIPAEVESSDAKDSEDSEVETSELTPKELRYKQQLEGEKKANRELIARLEALEKKVQTSTPQQQKELTAEEQQTLQEKQLLKEKYGVVTKEDYEALEKKFQTILDERMIPIKKEREQKILDKIYKKYPDVAPTNDPGDTKWTQVGAILRRILPENPSDPLSDFEQRFDWAHEKVFGNKNKVDIAKLRQASYTGVGGGTSAAKSKTIETEDPYAHLSPELKAYKAQIEAGVEEDLKRKVR